MQKDKELKDDKSSFGKLFPIILQTISVVIACLALIFSSVSMFASIRSSKASMKSAETASKSFEANMNQFKLNMRPRLSISHNLDQSESPLGIKIKNSGFGSAEITEFKIEYADSVEVINSGTDSVKVIFHILSEPKPLDFPIRFSLKVLTPGTVLSRDETVFPIKLSTNIKLDPKQQTAAIEVLKKICIFVNYKSLYDEKFTTLGMYKSPKSSKWFNRLPLLIDE